MLAEKGSGDNDDVELIRAAAGFRLVATMNPGGDFGKKEVKKVVALAVKSISNGKNVLYRCLQNPNSSLTFILYVMCFWTAVSCAQKPFYRNLVSAKQ